MTKPRMFLVSMEGHEHSGHHVVDHIAEELRSTFPQHPLAVQELQDDHLIPSLPVVTPTMPVRSQRLIVRFESALAYHDLRDRVIKALDSASLGLVTATTVHDSERLVLQDDDGLTDLDCQQRGAAAFYRGVEFDPIGGMTPTEPRLSAEEKQRYCLPPEADIERLRSWRFGWLDAAKAASSR